MHIVEHQVVASVVFLLTVLISIISNDRFYPFSRLGMFTAPYAPAVVVSLRSKDGETVYSSKKYLGVSASGLSRRFVSCGGASVPEEFCLEVETLLKHVVPQEGIWLWAKKIEVGMDGAVTRSCWCVGAVVEESP